MNCWLRHVVKHFVSADGALSLCFFVALSNLAPKAGAAAPANVATNGRGQGVLLIGDSMMKVGVGPALKTALAKSVHGSIAMHAKSSTGLARPDAYDWPLAAKGLLERASGKLSHVIVMMGANDCQSFEVGGKPLAFGSPAWTDVYRQRLQGFLGQLCGGAEHVVWIGLPPMRNVKFNHRIQQLNTLIASEVERSSCGRWIASPTELAGARGEFRERTRIANRWVRLREGDGIHVAGGGGQVITEAVMAHLPAAKGQDR